MQPPRPSSSARPRVSRLARLAGLAVAGGLALLAARPAAAQCGAPDPAVGDAAATTTGRATSEPAASEPAAPPAPALTVLAGAGVGSMGPSIHLVGRYTLWLNPRWGVGPEAFTGGQGLFVGSLEITGGDLAVAWRLPTRVADMVLHAGVGAASYQRFAGTGLLIGSADYTPPPPVTGVALTGAAEASAVFHPWRPLGVLLGARAEAVAPGRNLGPYWNYELVVGLSLTRSL